ncbi:WSC-domain-containing protein [Periconia macrospinosa]|uniref:WSC-domain-containing protein n=1 Tax=Periconia macrospinosa TaxID=97972 RepID=A0A2V1DC16_9PLEO|nr:WSC-domain-containing protein [Periconia macrospinosa]
MLSVLLSFSGLVALASTTELLVARNNPPQPPCVYPYTKFVYSGCFVDSVSSRALPFMTELEFNNATVEQCTAYCKGNNYRYAGLEYHGQCFCGTSVSSSAAAEAECNLPCNGDSTQVCGGQDRLSIYQDPTFPDADDIAISSDYKSLGCYTEGASGRSLDYSQWDYLNVSAMTTETCLTACGKKGFPFAGTEFGRECYCGVVLGNGTLPADAGQCSTPCTGNSTEICGGPDHLSLYVAKNLESTDQCGPPIISSSSSMPTPTPTSSTPTPSSSTPTPTSSSTTPCSGHYCPITSSSTSKPTSSTSSTPKPSTTKCVGYYCPIETPPKPPTSTSKSSSSTPKPSTTKCVGYCPIPPPGKPTTSTSKPPTSTSKSSTSTPKPSTTTKCSGYYCPIPPPGKPSTSTSTSKPGSSTSKSSASTPKTSSTTKCSGYNCVSPTTFHTTTTTPPWTPEIPPCEGILCWPPPNNPSTSCWLGLICAPVTSTSTSKPASSVKTTSSTKKPTTTSAHGYPTVPKPTHY